MSTADENTISFPVSRLKAETLRAIAKDLSVPPGGKKEEVLSRLRTSSSSGWNVITPAKRKADSDDTERASARKTSGRRRSPRKKGHYISARVGISSEDADSKSPIEPDSTAMEATDVSDGTGKVADMKPEVDAGPAAGENPSVDESTNNTKEDLVVKPVFDEYLVSGATSAFISPSELVDLIVSEPAARQGVSLLRKAATAFSDPEAKLDDRLHTWVIATVEGGNSSQFLEVYKDVLPDKGQEGGGWYEVSISRNSSKDAVNVRITKGDVSPVGEIQDAPEPSFWVSNPRRANQENSNILDQIIPSH